VTCDQENKKSVDQVKDEINEVVAPHALAVESVVDGKTQVQERSGIPDREPQRVSKLHRRVGSNAQQVVENERDIEGIPIRHDTQNQQDRSAQEESHVSFR
jgi:hypothetical protein